MLRNIKNSFPKKDLHRIAKTIQWHYRYNLSDTYRKAFDTISKLDCDEQIKYNLRLGIEDSLNPSSKLYSAKEVDKQLKSADLYEDQSRYKRIMFPTIFKLPTLKTIIEDLNAIMKDFSGINFTDDCLTVEMGPFELEGVNFGSFQAALSLKYLCMMDVEYSPQIYAVDPNYPKSDEVHPHPHVRGHEICLGGGRDVLYKSMSNARLQDCFQIISSVLNTYNGNDPYAHIERWTGEQCGNCEVYYDPNNDGVVCEKCEKPYCKSCVRGCCSKAAPVCYKCEPSQFNCSWCGKVLCSECVSLCKCNIRLCLDHMPMDNHRCKYRDR